MQQNRVMFAGFAGAPAEVKYAQSGMAIATVRVAHTERAKEGGQDKTTWMRIKAFGKTAEIASAIKKGDNVICEGKIEVSEWDDKDGNKRYATDIVAWQIGIISRSEKKEAAARPEIDPADIPF